MLWHCLLGKIEVSARGDGQSIISFLALTVADLATFAGITDDPRLDTFHLRVGRRDSHSADG
jgi:hypothetical protein